MSSRLVVVFCAALATQAAAFSQPVQKASTKPYVILKSGKCASPVTSLVACEQAAHELHMSDSTSTEDGQDGVHYDPPGCYLEGGSLKFNSKQSNTGPCSSTDVCVCKLAFVLTTSGKCVNPVTSLAACTQAGKTFNAETGAVPVAAADDRQSGVAYDPPGCYYEGEKLKYNSRNNNKGACSQEDVCVCKQNSNKFAYETYKDLGMGDCLPDLDNYANHWDHQMGNETCRNMCSELPTCLAYSEDGYTCRLYSNANVTTALTKLQPSYTWSLTPKCHINKTNCAGTEITTAVGASRGRTHCFKRLGNMQKCASEGGTCKCNGNVKYGVGSKWSALKHVGGSIQCTNAVFGDTAPMHVKECMCQSNGADNLHTCAKAVRGTKCTPDTQAPTAIKITLKFYNSQNCQAACEARAQARSGCCEMSPHSCTFYPTVVARHAGIGQGFYSTSLCTAGAVTGKDGAPIDVMLGTSGLNTCPAGYAKMSQAECRGSMASLGLAASSGINGAFSNNNDPGGCFKFSWGGNPYAYYNRASGGAKAGRTPICKKISHGWNCDANVNWIDKVQYTQTVIDDVSTAHVTSYSDAIAKCKTMCTGTCTGFFYQEHTNTHQICGFYHSSLAGMKFIHHAHLQGAVCQKTDTAASGTLCSTAAGEGTAPSTACVFPFVYKGNTYEKCSPVNNGGIAWCATTANYDSDKKWGNCVATASCKLPAVCKAVGGNDAGKACVFPFVYKRHTYTGCTAADNGGKLWCATTANYDTNQRWGNCNVAGSTGCTLSKN